MNTPKPSTQGHFSRCLARANIKCDVDEILWPDPDLRKDDENADAVAE